MVLTRREARAKKRKQKQEEKQKQKKASNSKPDEETRDAPSSGEEEIVQTSRSAAKPTGPRGSLVDVQEDGGFGFDNLGDSPVGPNSYEGNEYQHDEQEDDYFGADENGDDGVDDGEKGEDSAPSNDEENYEQDGGYFGDDGSRNSEDDGTSRLENREGNIDGTDHGFGGENFASSEDEGSYQGEDGFYGNIGSRNSQDEDGSELETGDNRDGSLPTGEPKELANNDDNSNQDDMSAGSGENSDDGDEDQFNSSFKGRYNGYGSDAHNEEEGELPGNEPDAKRDGFNLQDSPENFDDNKEGAGGVTGAEDYSNVMEGRNSDNYKYDFDDRTTEMITLKQMASVKKFRLYLDSLPIRTYIQMTGKMRTKNSLIRKRIIFYSIQYKREILRRMRKISDRVSSDQMGICQRQSRQLDKENSQKSLVNRTTVLSVVCLRENERKQKRTLCERYQKMRQMC